MGLGNWINRYIVEIDSGDTQQPAQPPTPETPPEQLAEAVELVPTARTPKDVLAELEPPTFDEQQLSNAPTPDPEESARLRAAAKAAVAAAAEEVSLAAPGAEPATPQRDPLDDGEDPPIDVPQVYAAAKIGPPLHGFTLEKIAGMLGDQRMAALPKEARASAIAVLLETAGVSIEDVVKDAAQRDQALDRFEDFLAEKLIDLEVEIDQENAELDAEIERLIARKKEQRAANEDRVHAKRVELARFRRVKRAEEQRLFDVASYFTQENPVDVTPVQRDTD